MHDLTTLLREAVEDVEPTDRRAELRELVGVSSGRRHRRYAIAGGLLAAASNARARSTSIARTRWSRSPRSRSTNRISSGRSSFCATS